MKLSIILIDWSVRESFHAIKYLNKQTVDRDKYEIIWVEFYDKEKKELKQYEQKGKLDKYLILGHLESSHYHKHITWNEGVLKSNGEIVVFPDSDSIFSETFVENILDFFSKNGNSFLLIDQVRNKNPKYFPFNYPSINEILEDEFTENYNYKTKTTNGLSEKNEKIQLPDAFFIRNYGACFSCKKNDFIRFGGLDEFEGYRSYICGVYELVFRMKNGGIKEKWLKKEFLVHTFHPWMKPNIDKIGPHFKHLSTISLKQFYDKNILSILENKKIFKLRKKESNYSKKPVITFLIPDLKQEDLFLNYYSIDKSTSLTFELIVPTHINTNGFKNVKNSFVDFYSFLKLKDFNFLVYLYNKFLFNDFAIDNFLKLKKDFVFFKVFSAVNQGFYWQEQSGFNNYPPFLVKADKLDKIFKIINQERRIIDNAPNLYNWNNEHIVQNKNYKKLIKKILDLEFCINNENKIDLLDEAKILLDKLKKLKFKDFISYFYLTRLSIMEFYRFLSVFSKNNCSNYGLDGYSMLTNEIPYLLEQIVVKIPNDFQWLKDIFSKDLQYFKGVSFFHIGNINYNLNNLKEARKNFKLCLKEIPSHVKAKKMLKKL